MELTSDDYLTNYYNCLKKYGKKTVVLMQYFPFYYMKQTDDKGPNIAKFCFMLDLIPGRMHETKEIDSNNPEFLGFFISSYEKYKNKLLSNGYTVVKIDQIGPSTNPNRKITSVEHPDNYVLGEPKFISSFDEIKITI